MADTQNVTIYSAPWCAFCHMAKRYLDEKGVKYKDIDVDSDSAAAQELVRKTGQAGIPVLEIGDETIIGFDRPRIDLALRANHLVK
ncbi:MAG TPA: glutaredoxin family protein [Candidatus Saccharimonadales bacterium]|nr:glutaredoxin family protein [Candidatus Saccharimonadales bacterium]